VLVCDESKLSEKGCTGKPRVDVLQEFELDLLKVFGPSEELKMPSPEKYRRF